MKINFRKLSYCIILSCLTIILIIVGPVAVYAELTGTIWQGAKAEAVVKQSKPLVFTPQVGLPGFMEKYVFNENSTAPIAKLMKAIFSYGIQIISLITLIVIIVGGFMWSTAGGNGNKVNEAKQWLFSGLSGLLLLLFSYLLLRTINIDLVNFRTRDIAAITRLNLIVPEKSNQEQVFGDQGFLDGVYAETFGDNPNNEACCVFYNKNIGADGLKVASIAYSGMDGFRSTNNFCLDFARNNGEGNARQYTASKTQTNTGREQFIILSKNDATNRVPNKPFRNWEQNDFVIQTEDLALFVVNDAACWSISSYLSNTAMGLDNPNYCKKVARNNNGWACIKTIGSSKNWGYCDNEECKLCVSYGNTCAHDYQCPNRKKVIGNSTVVSGQQCGNGGLSGLTSNAATCDRTHHCECASSDCLEECRRNLTDQTLLDNVCKGR